MKSRLKAHLVAALRDLGEGIPVFTPWRPTLGLARGGAWAWLVTLAL